MRKGRGKEAKLCFGLHALTENRNNLILDVAISLADGTAERTTALQMLDRVHRRKRSTLGADRGYDTKDFVQACKARGVSPHVVIHGGPRRKCNLDGRTLNSGGYKVSLRKRMAIEEVFGWMKSFGGLRRTRFKGRARTQMWAEMVASASNLLRMTRLVAA